MPNSSADSRTVCRVDLAQLNDLGDDVREQRRDRDNCTVRRVLFQASQHTFTYRQDRYEYRYEDFEVDECLSVVRFQRWHVDEHHYGLWLSERLVRDWSDGRLSQIGKRQLVDAVAVRVCELLWRDDRRYWFSHEGLLGSWLVRLCPHLVRVVRRQLYAWFDSLTPVECLRDWRFEHCWRVDERLVDHAQRDGCEQDFRHAASPSGGGRGVADVVPDFRGDCGEVVSFD